MILIDRTVEKLALGPARYPEIARLLREHPDLDHITHSAVVYITDGKRCRAARELRAARDAARNAFAKENGWAPGPAFSSSQLRRARRERLDASGLTAHQNGPIDYPEYLYERGAPVAILSHTKFEIGQLDLFAQCENFRLRLFRASWIAPGERLAAVFVDPTTGFEMRRRCNVHDNIEIIQQASSTEIAQLVRDVESARRTADEAGETYLLIERRLRSAERKAADAFAARLGLRVGPSFTLTQLLEGRPRFAIGDLDFDFAPYDRQTFFWRDDKPAAVVNHSPDSWRRDLGLEQYGLRVEVVADNWVDPAGRVGILILHGDPS